MKRWSTIFALLCTAVSTSFAPLTSDNQTPTVSEILPGSLLPFSVSIEQADFQLPSGFHSGAFGNYGDKWLFIAGRTNGLHGFANDDNNFPPQQQNTFVIVVDFGTEQIFSRSLNDQGAGLSQREVDSLSVTSPQFYQRGNTLYMTGGYGVDTITGLFNTKDALTAIDLPGLIHWVVNPSFEETAQQHIRQIFHPIFQVTGGYMYESSYGPTLLILGQNFDGFYNAETSGDYTNQVRRFHIIDDGQTLSVKFKEPKPCHHDSSFRRRDLNVVPFINKHCGQLHELYVALSGVFTVTGGIWTIPIIIDSNGNTKTFSSSEPSTFKQGMNNYVSATIGLYSKYRNNMYTTLFGGLSFGYFNGNTFETDPEIPFINQVTTIKYDCEGRFAQFLMEEEFPEILSTWSNPGNVLLFGTAAELIPNNLVKRFQNGVIDFDALPSGSTFVGWIIGGIVSTLPNTNSESDSAASPYIFRVFVTK